MNSSTWIIKEETELNRLQESNYIIRTTWINTEVNFTLTSVFIILSNHNNFKRFSKKLLAKMKTHINSSKSVNSIKYGYNYYFEYVILHEVVTFKYVLANILPHYAIENYNNFVMHFGNVTLNSIKVLLINLLFMNFYYH